MPSPSSEGTALPDLAFDRIDDEAFECRWIGSSGDEVDEFERVLFLTHGRMEIRAAELQCTLTDFVNGVLERLDAVVPGDPRAEDLRRTWATAQDPVDPDFARITLAARLGLHWWALGDAQRREVSRIEGLVSNPVADAGIDAIRPESIDAWLEASGRLWARCEVADASSPAWHELRGSLLASAGGQRLGVRPWDRGWEWPGFGLAGTTWPLPCAATDSGCRSSGVASRSRSAGERQQVSEGRRAAGAAA